MSPSSAKSAKFTFDTEFRDGGEVASPAALGRQKKVMTTDEIEAMCARAKQEGTETGQVRATESVERTVAALVISIRAALDQSRAVIEEIRAEATQLAVAAAKKIAPAALAALPAGDVEAALREAMQGRTTFVVSGRLNLLRRADVILVLDGGKLIQSGTHEELVEVPGPYHDTAVLQIMDLDDAPSKEGK